MSNGGPCISPTALISNPHLKKVLRTYAANAMNSLSGPGSFQDAWTSNGSTSNKMSGGGIQRGGPSSASVVIKSSSGSLPPPFPIQPAPVFSQPDQLSSERCDTVLEDQKISCFVVGGERRLCLPQLLNTVLTSRSLEEINMVCDELHIYISRCTGSQLDCLKASKILPSSAPSCGLITLTDAERLCGALMHKKPDQEFSISNREKCRHIPVMHRCFGKIRGTAFLDLFTHPDAACIECVQCKGIFSPRHFVLHSHKSMQHRLCHWGFDSQNWRLYLSFPEELSAEAKINCQPLMQELKSKFSSSLNESQNSLMAKRSKSGPVDHEDHSRMTSKRIKIEEAVYPNSGGFGPVAWYIPRPPGGATGLIASPDDLSNKFSPHAAIPVVCSTTPPSPMPSYLNRGPPIVINPDRIVLASPFEKFDDKFQPNVALVPPPMTITRQPGVITSLKTLEPLHFPSPVHASSTNVSLVDSSCVPSGSGSILATQAHDPESEDESSSNSTLSIDFGQESAILEGDEEDLNCALMYADIDTRSRIVQVIKRMKLRYGGMLSEAQHDKTKIEKDLQYYKVIRKDKIRTLKVSLADSQREVQVLKNQLTSKSVEIDQLAQRVSELESKSSQEEYRLVACSEDKDGLYKRIQQLEADKQTLEDQLKVVEERRKSPPVSSSDD